MFKDVIEPLESVSVNLVVTGKEDVKELGSPQEVICTCLKVDRDLFLSLKHLISRVRFIF